MKLKKKTHNINSVDFFPLARSMIIIPSTSRPDEVQFAAKLTSTFMFSSLRLEDAVSRSDKERTEKLNKWHEITVKTKTINSDSRSKLNEIKSKDPHTTPEIQEQLEEIQVKNAVVTIITVAHSLTLSLAPFLSLARSLPSSSPSLMVNGGQKSDGNVRFSLEIPNNSVIHRYG